MLVWQGHWPLLVNAIIWILGRLVAFRSLNEIRAMHVLVNFEMSIDVLLLLFKLIVEGKYFTSITMRGSFD